MFEIPVQAYKYAFKYFQGSWRVNYRDTNKGFEMEFRLNELSFSSTPVIKIVFYQNISYYYIAEKYTNTNKLGAARIKTRVLNLSSFIANGESMFKFSDLEKFKDLDIEKINSMKKTIRKAQDVFLPPGLSGK